MFKSMLKRSWLSTIRKPSRTIILALVLFAMANLVLAAIVIKNAVSESMDSAKRTVGSTVMLQPDMEKVRSEMQTQMQSGGMESGERPTMVRPNVSVETVTSIADSDYVKDFTYSINSTANAESLTAVETSNNSMGGGGMMMNFGGSQSGEGEDSQPTFGNFTISGVNAWAFVSGVDDKTVTITDGEYFDENSDNKVMISRDLADENDLKVGDKISLTNINSDATIELTIQGIFDSTDENANPNALYMNVETAAKFLSDDEYNGGDFGVSSVQFFMNDPDETDTFIAEAKEKYPELETDNLKLDVDTDAYDQMVGPIESVGSFATTILVVVIVASVVIITLMVTINIKDRRYEMGVLLSLGAKKMNITGQILTELLIVGTVAFALAIPTSSVLARSMGDGLLSSQIAASETESEENFGRPGTMTGGGGMRGGGPQMQMGGGNLNNNNVEAIDTIDVSATPGDYAILFGIGYAVIILSMIVPTANVLRFQPKTILSGKE